MMAERSELLKPSLDAGDRWSMQGFATAWRLQTMVWAVLTP